MGKSLTLGSVTPLDWTNMTRWTNLMQPSRTPTGPESHKLKIFDFMVSILSHVALAWSSRLLHLDQAEK